MDLYTLHTAPTELDFYSEADTQAADLVWERYKNQPSELAARERAIAASAEISWKYVFELTHKPFPAGAHHFSKDPRKALAYARYVLRGRFRDGEEAIISGPQAAEQSFLYAQDALGGKFERGEDAILTSPDFTWLYVRDVLKTRFKKGEPILASVGVMAYNYAFEILGGPFEAGEESLSTSQMFAELYAANVLKADFYHDGKLIAKYK